MRSLKQMLPMVKILAILVVTACGMDDSIQDEKLERELAQEKKKNEIAAEKQKGETDEPIESVEGESNDTGTSIVINNTNCVGNCSDSNGDSDSSTGNQLLVKGMSMSEVQSRVEVDSISDSYSSFSQWFLDEDYCAHGTTCYLIFDGTTDLLDSSNNINARYLDIQSFK